MAWNVTGKMQVDILHRHHLCIAAACCAALYTEYRSEGGLAERYHNVLADLAHNPSARPTLVGRLSFAGGRRR